MPRGRRGKKSDSVLFKSAEWIGWALGGLEREIEETRARLKALTDQAAALRSRVGVAARRGVAAAVAANAAGKPAGPSRRGRMSAEGRRRMSEMMKKRWQEAKKKNRNRL
jgi:branched-subunit amino acid aminotransferase/4-amino-4-deoxychorismate lyase